MQASELMTKDVVVVSSDTPTAKIAKLLLEHAISAVPVVGSEGAPIGMVSEGDLIGRAQTDREARRDWWLTLAAGDGAAATELLKTLRSQEQTAGDIMSAPVVTVDETTEVGEIARLLATYRIKRVPVLQDGRIVGIVSRADILRAFAAAQTRESSTQSSHAEGVTRGLISEAISHLDERFFGHAHAGPDHVNQPSAKPPSAALGLSVADLRELVADAEHRKLEHQDEARRAAALKRSERVEEIINHHITDESWRGVLHRAREAAERGEKEIMLLRFPSDLCRDGGRAINVSEPDWPASLRGEPAEIYLRWEHELRPRGFHLAARVLDFPGGMPGDIGLFLVWGE